MHGLQAPTNNDSRQHGRAYFKIFVVDVEILNHKSSHMKSHGDNNSIAKKERGHGASSLDYQIIDWNCCNDLQENKDQPVLKTEHNKLVEKLPISSVLEHALPMASARTTIVIIQKIGFGGSKPNVPSNPGIPKVATASRSSTMHLSANTSLR